MANQPAYQDLVQYAQASGEDSVIKAAQTELTNAYATITSTIASHKTLIIILSIVAAALGTGTFFILKAKRARNDTVW
jgi:hypothetical protein